MNVESVATEVQQCAVCIVAIHIYHCRQYETPLGFCVQYPIFLSDFKQVWSYMTDFCLTSPNNKFHRKSVH